MRILVLGGGDSPEREVSLRSAKAIAEAARAANFEVLEADPKDNLSILDNLPDDTIIFPILHGAGGEDGQIQREFEQRHLKYLGSDSQSSAECFDKWLTRQRLESAGIPMPAGVLVSKNTYKSQPLAKKPHVLKVLRGGSSIGTLLAQNPNKVTDFEVESLFTLDTNAELEEFIEGTEVTVPILDETALPVIEIVPPIGEEFDYENKYNGRTQEICPPQTVSQDLQTKCQALAETVHKTMNCRHLSRVDIMINKHGKLLVLEVNTMPGLTDQSLYPKSAAANRITMSELVKRFVDMVQRDYSN
ncbi:D-alanine--D-alanine ligase [Candidatus Saccharibacteria bacterium]|nr:D-alanine--D-alanine ligase [Candidatus Saccharibacteria bacterium]